MPKPIPTFFEFFAGGGMARAGLGANWRCTFANDFSRMKAAAYTENWGDDHFLCEDVGKLKLADLPGKADLAWASFPCQDLSLAGDYAGLGNFKSKVLTRSGTFWPFWNLIKGLKLQARSPRLVVLENVYGAITSNGGKDFVAIASAIASIGYRFGAIVVDAIEFVPQSRQRVFFIAVQADLTVPDRLVAKGPIEKWHPKALVDVFFQLPEDVKQRWLWWSGPAPSKSKVGLKDIIEENPTGVNWHEDAATKKLLGMMSPLNLSKVRAAQNAGHRMIGCVYKRTRVDRSGTKMQRAEVRFDDVAGCLRTPAGGSSRQTVLVVDGPKLRSRLLSSREAARLMGLPDTYQLPHRYNDAYHLAGDGVCVPVVRYIANSFLEPVLRSKRISKFQLAAD